MNEKTLVSAAITACVAQLVEQRIRNAQVAGSSPAASSRVLPKFRRDFYFSYMYKSKRGSVGTLVRRRAFRRPTARRAALRPEMSSAFEMRKSPVRVRPQAPLTLPRNRKGFCFICRKTDVFPTRCVLTSQNTDVRKFPFGNFLPPEV